MSKASALKSFQIIPVVGVQVALDLWNLGYREIAELKNDDPEQMFERLCVFQQGKVDRCMLYTFRCACYFARTENPDPDLLKWWNWSDKKLKL